MNLFSGIKARFASKGKHKKTSCCAVILAAGMSQRMNLEEGRRKPFISIEGVPLIAYTLKAFERSVDITELIVVANPDDFSAISDISKTHGISKLKNIVEGGQTRFESSLYGVLECSKRCDFIAIHDAARPFVTEQVIHDAFKAAVKYGAAAPGVVPNDTVKEVDADGIVVKTHARSALRQIQTPQIFRSSLIFDALMNVKKTGADVTDDCSAVELMKKPVVITQGDRINIKVTTPSDLSVCIEIIKNMNAEESGDV